MIVTKTTIITISITNLIFIEVDSVFMMATIFVLVRRIV